jgi:hypothetical protein
MAATDSNQISALARLFSSGVIKELARDGMSSMFARLAHQSAMFDVLGPRHAVADLFDAAFAVLHKRANRHEYIYKAALTHKVLLGTHSLHTASMLTEFRVGDCKADVAILNGTGTVYEIKSERDSLSRLPRQIEAYKSVFAKVYVIAGENHVRSVLDSVAPEVGVLLLSGRNQISTLREAADEPERTSPLTILESVRVAEAKVILDLLGVAIPDVPNTAMFASLCDIFEKLEPASVHGAMVKALKKTRNLLPLAELVDSLPHSLQTAALTVPMRKVDHSRLAAACRTPLSVAATWA